MVAIGASPSQESSPAAAQSPKQSSTKKKPTPEEIIQQFSEKETAFYEAWMQYMYTQTTEIRVRSVNGERRNEVLKIVSEVVFKDDGTREVKTLRHSDGLRSIGMTKEDKEILENLHPFALTAKDIPLYTLTYIGKERADELECYLFSVKPKKIKKGQLYFEGKIWVDDQDLQIVKTVGKPVPQKINNQFPEFETIRQSIDNQFWFPVWTHADSELYFREDVIRVEETITYDNYKKFRATAKILSATPVEDEEK